MRNQLSNAKRADDSQVEMTQVVLPQFANAIGTVFGGQIVSWIDICAAVAAQRHCRMPVVTASIDSVHFTKPIKQGQVVVLKGRVNAVFRTSLEIGVIVFAEDPTTGEKFKAVRAYCTFVALGENGAPAHIPGLIVESDEDIRRERDAGKRRQQRLLDRR
jgi:acyl-CoA hydrolase